MNLLAKKRGAVLWMVAAGVVLLGGCREDMGIELPPEVQRTEIKFIDLQLPVTNMYFDSLRTDRRRFVAVGEYADATYGSVEGAAYTEILFKSGSLPDEDFLWIDKGDFSDSLTNLTFGGGRIVLDVVSPLTNDNFLELDLQIEQLADTIFGGVVYLSNRSIPTSGVVGGGVVSLADLSTIKFDSVEVPVSVPLTPEYSESIRAKFDEDSALFADFGLKISSPISNGIALFDLLSDTTEIQLLVHGDLYDTATLELKKDTVVTTVRFRMSGSQHFNQLTRDLSGSIFSGVQDKQEVDPDAEHAFINELSGISTRIDLTDFIEFAETTPNLLVNRASILVPVTSNSGNVPDFSSVVYYFTKGEGLSVNWPGIPRLQYYNTILLSDGSYVSSSQPNIVNTALAEVDSDFSSEGFTIAPSVFLQYLYQRARQDVEGVPEEERSFIVRNLKDVNGLLLWNSGSPTLGRNAIPKEGVTLRLYYTVPRTNE